MAGACPAGVAALLPLPLGLLAVLGDVAALGAVTLELRQQGRSDELHGTSRVPQAAPEGPTRRPSLPSS